MKIKVYSTPQCKSCKEVKDYLCSKNIPFESIDISKMEMKDQLNLNRRTGRLSVPIIEVNSKFFYSLKELREVL